jgi:hypothetical protein
LAIRGHCSGHACRCVSATTLARRPYAVPDYVVRLRLSPNLLSDGGTIRFAEPPKVGDEVAFNGQKMVVEDVDDEASPLPSVTLARPGGAISATP